MRVWRRRWASSVILTRNRVRSTYRNVMGTGPVYHAVRAPLGRRCGYHRAEDTERVTRHRCHGAAQGISCGRQDGAGVELTARAVGERNAGTVLRAAMAVTAFVPGGDAPGDVDNNVSLMLPSKRPITFQDS